jgi:hypothetical protein
MDKNLEYLLDEYVDRMDYLTKSLGKGSVASIEEYRYICGQIRGLEAACAVIKDLKIKIEINANVD